MRQPGTSRVDSLRIQDAVGSIPPSGTFVLKHSAWAHSSQRRKAMMFSEPLILTSADFPMHILKTSSLTIRVWLRFQFLGLSSG